MAEFPPTFKEILITNIISRLYPRHTESNDLTLKEEKVVTAYLRRVTNIVESIADIAALLPDALHDLTFINRASLAEVHKQVTLNTKQLYAFRVANQSDYKILQQRIISNLITKV